MYKYIKRTDPLDLDRVVRCEIYLYEETRRELVAYVWKTKNKTAVENAAMICEALNNLKRLGQKP
jgi:hypothetical protein